MGFLTPIVIEKTGRGERSYDIWSRLLKDRIVFIGTPIDDYVANLVIAQMLFLQMENKSQDINIYINTPGGNVMSGLAIYDTMQYIKSPISTLCMGQAASMGAVLLAAGSEGKRYALPNARVMIHQPLGGAEGQASDIKIQADEIVRLRKRLNKILSSCSKQTMKKIEHDTDRNYFMNADEAKKYGLIDKVLNGRSK